MRREVTVLKSAGELPEGCGSKCDVQIYSYPFLGGVRFSERAAARLAIKGGYDYIVPTSVIRSDGLFDSTISFYMFYKEGR